MLSRKLIKHQPKRRLITYTAALSVLALTLGLAGTALAVHDEEFQLDGNVTDEAADDQDFDWTNFFDANGAESPVLPDASRPDFTVSGFDRDFNTNTNGTFNTSDSSTFATGSKDTLPITPGWQCSFSSNVNSKTDVTNVYALQYVDPGTGDEILYFGLERNANTGTGNVGFWFLQSAVACESAAGNQAFSGDHVDGDLLVVSEFSNGGAVATIQAYEWVGGANGALNPNPIASGASCSSASGGDSVCAQVNTGTITTPWLTANKQDGAGHSLRVSEFFEAGLNLTDAGLGDTCFNTFMGVTRSSTSLTATIFDYALGQLGDCESSISSDQNWLPNDDATVTVTGAGTWSGAVDFTLYEGSLDCNVADTGVSVYSEADLAVSNTDPDVATSNSTFVATATETYSWLVEFTPSPASEAAGVLPASHCESTSLTITN